MINATQLQLQITNYYAAQVETMPHQVNTSNAAKHYEFFFAKKPLETDMEDLAWVIGN